MGTDDFLGFRTHVFPGGRKAKDLWGPVETHRVARTDLPAYDKLATAGVDQCGLSQLAGRTVGAPFVGAVASACVISEALRLVNGAHCHDLIDGNLRELKHLTAVTALDETPVNPGSSPASPRQEKTSY